MDLGVDPSCHNPLLPRLRNAQALALPPRTGSRSQSWLSRKHPVRCAVLSVPIRSRLVRDWICRGVSRATGPLHECATCRGPCGIPGQVGSWYDT